MKLFIDDIRRCPEGWEVARTVTEAIRILATRSDIWEVSIDHDASHGVDERTDMEVGCPNDFTAVAYFIGEKWKCQPKWAVPKISVHSANPDGVKRIEGILKDYGLVASL